MISLNDKYFAVERPVTGVVDVFKFGQKAEVVKCQVCTTMREAIIWANNVKRIRCER